MKRVLFDTNILIPYLRNPEAFSDKVMSYDRVVITPTVLGEFRAGITPTRQGMENLRALDDFLLNPAVEECPVTLRHKEGTKKNEETTDNLRGGYRWRVALPIRKRLRDGDY
jgi:predicted nucleic acid-binding protein